MWVYIKSEPQLWTVGFYAPDGSWRPDSDHSNRGEAANRTAWLNGSGTASGHECLTTAGVSYGHQS